MRSGMNFCMCLSILIRFSYSEIVTITNVEMEEVTLDRIVQPKS